MASAPRAPAPAADGARFFEWEARWLGELGAVDPRLALRMPVKPSRDAVERLAAAAVVRGDTDVGIVGGAIDLFSYAERERTLGALRAELEAQPDGGAPAARDEKVLLRRLLDGEDLRAAREQVSPESASDRVRAMVETWDSGPKGATPAREIAGRERLVSRGLLDVVADVAAGRLRGPRVLELEDALDALERLAVPEGYPEATKIITTLRVELGKSHPVPPVRVTPAPLTLTAALRAYFGDLPGVHDRDALVARLDEEEVALRDDAKARLAKLPEHTVNDVLAAAAPHVDLEAPCPPAGAAIVGARAMRAPPERALACDALALAARAVAPLDETVATVALHDDVAIALWALALDAGATDLDATRTAHPLLASVAADRQDRLVRAALVSPARAIAPGLAAVLLDAEGPSARRDRATRWLDFGDAPFDAVASHLGGMP